jgi:cellulose synthase/poly-beta-1,6-N-acetylglucosamine synthase-like glycosyltransferase
MLLAVVILAFFCSLIPAALFCVNLWRYREPPAALATAPHVAVLIPARNEEANIEACVRSVLASHGLSRLEVLVMDDASVDRTAEIVQAMTVEDARVQRLHAPSLPAGWNGKQHACHQLAQITEAPLLLFLDADVRLAPDAVARMAAFRQQSAAALVSGFPRQVTVTFLEWLLLPLIHFVLLGFLPVGSMRKRTSPAFAAGCGQFLLVDRAAYFASGGHAGIRETMHDGLQLPQLLRRHGYKTDLADLTDLAVVRMYGSAREVWNGLAKNATEGLGNPKRIVPLTLLLVLGQVAPLLLSVLWASTYLWAACSWRQMGGYSWSKWADLLSVLVALSLVFSYFPRILAVSRFRQPLRSALLHPVGMVLLLALQWYALVRQMCGRPVGWRGRNYASTSGAELQQP